MSDHTQPSPARPAAIGGGATPPVQSRLLEQVIAATASSGFDADAWHVMEKRDESLIEQEILSGSASAKFVYQFPLQGSTVSGISVVGARHLAYHYGGLQHRMIASVEKRGALFIYTTYPHDGTGMRVETNYLHDLAGEDDFYSCLIEMEDRKKGNRIQVEKRETRTEKKRDGGSFERPHFQVIAQSKAYRNAVLALVPQDVQLQWKEAQLKLGKGEVVTASVADEKRSGVLRYAAAQGFAVNRHAVEALTLDQITGLGDAARSGDAAVFRRSALALGILTVSDAEAITQEPPKPRQTRQPRQQAPEPQPAPQEPPRVTEPPPPTEPPHDPGTGELLPQGEGGRGDGELEFK